MPQLRYLTQSPRGVGQVQPRYGAKIRATRRDDSVDLIGAGDRAHGDRRNAAFVADPIGERNLQPTFYCLESFFYDPKTPIASRAAEYQLQGAGYRWRHAGMDWQRAAELVEHGYRSVQGSTVLPLYSFDLWSFAYLLGTGIEETRLRRFLEAASAMMVDAIGNPAYHEPQKERQLEGIFAA